ncbi:hypothetical protein ACWEWX_52935, partial [Streptomyces asiaticus]
DRAQHRVLQPDELVGDELGSGVPGVGGGLLAHDEIEERVLANDNWYLWWGLRTIGLRTRIRMAREESRRIEAELMTHLPRRGPAPTPLVATPRREDRP